MLLTAEILSKLASYEPQIKHHSDVLHAAVALVLRDGKHGTEVLMIQRATDARDPWSGQMAFPGGKIDLEDSSHQAAAIRETSEEVSVELCDSECVGRLDDLYGLHSQKQYSVMVSSFVFKIDKPIQPKANYEVADMVWVPLQLCNDSSRACIVQHPQSGDEGAPGIMLDQSKNQIVWGLSVRVLLCLFDVLALPMQALDGADNMRLINSLK